MEINIKNQHSDPLFSAELYPFLVRTFASYARLNQVNQFAQSAKSIKKNLFMQNKPNLCVFWAVSGDCEEKQTQTNPIQSQNKANSSLSAPPKAKTNPILTQSPRPSPKNYGVMLSTDNAAAIDEAIKAREEGKEKVILFNYSGHSLMDLTGYDAFLSGKLSDYTLPDDEIQKYTEPLKQLPKAEIHKSGKWQIPAAKKYF